MDTTNVHPGWIWGAIAAVVLITVLIGWHFVAPNTYTGKPINMGTVMRGGAGAPAQPGR